MDENYYGATDQFGEFLRRLGQYRATRGMEMPSRTQTGVVRGILSSSADEASRRYARARQNRLDRERLDQQGKMTRLAEQQQDAQAMSGYMGLGYKMAGGEEGLKGLWDKTKGLFDTYELPDAYNPAAAGAPALAESNIMSLADTLGIDPDTAKNMLGDYLDVPGYQAILNEISGQGGAGASSEVLSGGSGDEYLSGGGGTDRLVSGSGIPTIGGGGEGLASVDRAGLINEALPGAFEPWSNTGEILYPPEIWDVSGKVLQAPTNVFDIPGVAPGATSAGISAVSDLLSGGKVDVGKAAKSAGLTTAGYAVGSALTGGNPVGGTVGSIIANVGENLFSGGGGSVLCTELHRQGGLEKEALDLDTEYGSRLDPEVISGYHSWGIPLARAMSRNKALTWLLKPFIRAWAHTMASRLAPEKYKPRRLGLILEAVGLPLCRWIGRWLLRPQPATVLASRLRGPYLVVAFGMLERLPRGVQRQFVDACLEVAKHVPKDSPRGYRVMPYSHGRPVEDPYAVRP